MASLAGFGSGLVEEHQVVAYCFLERMAGRAGNILMSSFERKGSFLVIEERGAPLVAVVAGGTVAGLVAELVCMWVFVALVATLRSICKVDMEQSQLHVRRFVAFDACHGAM